ncbi:hypothetical protein PENTCL1PPCAC_7081, partial [Pristionchus entomophagus]
SSVSMELDGMASSSTVSKCEGCGFNSDNFLVFLQHRATCHHLKMESEVKTVTPPSSFPCSDCDQSFDSAANLSQHTVLVHGQFGNLLNMFAGGESSNFPAFLLNSQLPNPFSSLTNTPPVVKPPPAKRNYSSAGKNYCDVCNKKCATNTFSERTC